jgi:hypothetical protein
VGVLLPFGIWSCFDAYNQAVILVYNVFLIVVLLALAGVAIYAGWKLAQILGVSDTMRVQTTQFLRKVKEVSFGFN